MLTVNTNDFCPVERAIWQGLEGELAIQNTIFIHYSSAHGVVYVCGIDVQCIYFLISQTTEQPEGQTVTELIAR